MNTQGPYYFSPYGEGGGHFGEISQSIPVILGRNGYLEVLNLSNYNIIVSLQSMGQVTQDARSKVLYKIVQDIQGAQMVTISTPANGTSPAFPDHPIRLPVSYQNGETGFLGVWFNTYEEGEIEPYSPVSLSNPPAQSSYYISKLAAGAFTLVLPNTATFYGIPANLGTCDLLGFDLTSEGASTAANYTLTISNVNNQPDGSTTLVYVAGAAAGGAIAPLTIRFPTPIPNFGGTQITFTLAVSAGFNSTNFALNAYYSLT